MVCGTMRECLQHNISFLLKGVTRRLVNLRIRYACLGFFVVVRERELPPRFAQPNSLEFAIAARWKQAYDEEKVQRDELEQRLKVARNDIQKEMEVIKEQHRTNLLRQEFARHQEEGMRLAEQLRRRGEHISGLGMGFPPPPPGGIPPAPSLLQQPPGLGQGIPPAPLFPSPGDMKSDGRVCS